MGGVIYISPYFYVSFLKNKRYFYFFLFLCLTSVLKIYIMQHIVFNGIRIIDPGFLRVPTKFAYLLYD